MSSEFCLSEEDGEEKCDDGGNDEWEAWFIFPRSTTGAEEEDDDDFGEG